MFWGLPAGRVAGLDGGGLRVVVGVVVLSDEGLPQEGASTGAGALCGESGFGRGVRGRLGGEEVLGAKADAGGEEQGLGLRGEVENGLGVTDGLPALADQLCEGC